MHVVWLWCKNWKKILSRPIKSDQDFLYVKIYNKIEIVCETVQMSLFLDEFVFVKYFKLSNFKLLNGQLFVSLNWC